MFTPTEQSDMSMQPLKTPIRHFLLVIPVEVCAIVSAGGAFGAEPDGDAAQALAKKSNCLKCHSIDKKKDGPAFKVTAEKYKGKAEAEDKLVKHITTGPMVKIDGKEEEHEIVKSKSDPEVRNLVRWIILR